MGIDKKALEHIQRLVGDITENNLKYVDCYVNENFGLFLPSVGFCKYAITPHHTHPAYSFVLFFSEEQCIIPVEVEVSQNHYLVVAMSPDIAHEEEEKDTFTRYIAIFISKEFYERLYSIYTDTEPPQYFWKQFLINQDIMIYIKKFMSEYENKQLGDEQIIESLSTIITHQLIRSVLKINTPKDILIDKFEIEKVIEYMNQNFGEKLTVGRLSKLVNISESHFIRIFKKETQLSPIEYLIKLRIDKSKKLLRDSAKSITEIALHCGFNSASHFSTCFVRQLGKTPKEYQNLYLK